MGALKTTIEHCQGNVLIKVFVCIRREN